MNNKMLSLIIHAGYEGKQSLQKKFTYDHAGNAFFLI